jgi:acetyl esterase/lipase
MPSAPHRRAHLSSNVRPHKVTIQPASLERKKYVCRTSSGHSLEVDVIGRDAATLQPCVMWIHGGGLIFGSRTMSPRPFLAEALIDRGFIIASVDHRLAPEVKLEEIVEDVGELWRWLHDAGPNLFGVDPRRICAAGASAGAYLALIAGYKLLPKPRAVASLWGFGDITAPWEAEPSEHYLKAPMVSRGDALASLPLTPIPTASGEDRSLFYLYCRQQGLWLQEVTGHSLPGDLEWLQQYCPLHHIEQDFPPTVLVHGLNDSDVPASESDCLVATLRRKGVAHAYHSLPGVGHGFSGASIELVQSTEWAVAEFLHAHVPANGA